MLKGTVYLGHYKFYMQFLVLVAIIMWLKLSSKITQKGL